MHGVAWNEKVQDVAEKVLIREDKEEESVGSSLIEKKIEKQNCEN